jgi:hypothetical protein
VLAGRSLGFVLERIAGSWEVVPPDAEATLGSRLGPLYLFGQLGPEAADPVDVVGGNGEAQQHGDLGQAEETEEPPGRLMKRPGGPR